jgi:hypothetical protein
MDRMNGARKCGIYTHIFFFSHKEEKNRVVCRKMDGTRDDHITKNKPDSTLSISLKHIKLYNYYNNLMLGL